MSDCLIIGGGIIGMMSARMLALAGASVVLLDQSECGKESSWAGGGIISPLYPWQYDDLTNEFSFASQAVYQDLCADLFEASGIDTEYQKTGLLMIDEFDTNAAQAWMQRYKVQYQPHPQGALFPQIASVRNPRLLQALRADIILRGVKIIENTAVNNLIINKNSVLGAHSSKGDFLAKNVVMCAGAWSGKLLNQPRHIFPIKGQMIVLRAPIGTVKHIILNQGRYLIPRVDGKILVGSSMENVGFNRALDTQTKNNLHAFAYQHIPALKSAQIVHHWSGFRPATQSGRAIVAKDKTFKHLFINAGHFRNGLNMAPESAKRIVKLIKNL